MKCTTSSSIMPSVFHLVKKYYKVLLKLVDEEEKNIAQIVNEYLRPKYKFDPSKKFEDTECGRIVIKNRNDMFWKLFAYLLHKRHEGPLLPQEDRKQNFSRHISVGLHLHFAISL